MGGPIFEQKKEKTRESFQPIEREEERLEQHGAGPAELLPEEDWAQHDRAHTLEVMRNQQMAVELHQKSSGVTVNQAASVQHPPFQQRPAHKSGKADKEAKKKRRLAKKINPQADERTYEMAEAIFRYSREHENTITMEDKERAVHLSPRADDRMLRIFGVPFSTNSQGRPATELDRIKYSADRRFIDDYLSGDRKKRKPHLERITEDMLNMKFTEDMLSDDNIRKNTAALKLMADKAVYISNVMKENQDYFKELPAEKRAKLHAFNNVWMYFPYAFTHKLEAMHLQISATDKLEGIITNPEMEDMKTFRENAAEFESQYREALRRMQSGEPLPDADRVGN